MIDSLQKEAERLQYSLRSSFFYRRRVGFKLILNEINALDSSQHQWKPSAQLGISSSSFNRVTSKGISLCSIFCHPQVIISKPKLIAYYRSVAGIPQKGISRLGFAVGAQEEKGTYISSERAYNLAMILNSYISSIVDSDPDFSLEDARLIAIMNFGTQINGSWRNEIGAEGSRRVKGLLIGYFENAGMVAQLSTKAGKEITLKALPQIDDLGVFTLANSYKVVFGSEPDISIFSPNGVPEVIIEVKAGIDTAGALERYGAAKKSFDRALKENKAATTIYLASCITESVKKAMADDRLVRRDFNLTDIFTSDAAKTEFMNFVQWLTHL